MDPSDASGEPYLTLRRVEREQRLIELLHAVAERRTFDRLANSFGVSSRTIARDCERLLLSGVPLEIGRGRLGGVRLSARAAPRPITFDLPEIAALMSSLTALGPTATDSAASAMTKLARALDPDRDDA